MLPDLISSKTQNRRNHARKHLDHLQHGCLSRATCPAVDLRGVLTIFDDIKIKPTEFRYAEIVNFLIDTQEIVAVIMIHHFSLQQLALPDDPVVQSQQLVGRQSIFSGFKSVQIGQHETRRIPYPAVRICHPLENFI